MKNVAIVGNGTIAKDQLTAIESADLVIRFNDCRSAVAGTFRTDVVAVCNTGGPAKAMLRSQSWCKHPAVTHASGIWCVRDPRKFSAMRPLIAVLHPQLDDFCDDATAGFRAFCSEHGKQCVVIDELIHDQVDDALYAYGPTPYVAPSSGMIVIANVLERFADAAIAIAGFEHMGWEHHPFAAERRLVDSYVSSGRLRRL